MIEFHQVREVRWHPRISDPPPGAGPELDALVATHVMGWEYVIDGEGEGWCGPDQQFIEGYSVDVPGNLHLPAPPYSTDLAAAWLVVQKLEPYHFDLGLFNDGWLCRLCVGNNNTRHYSAYGGQRHGGNYWAPQGAALAICRAALLTSPIGHTFWDPRDHEER